MIHVLEGEATKLNAQPDHVNQLVSSTSFLSVFNDSITTGIPLGVNPFRENKRCKSEIFIDTWFSPSVEVNTFFQNASFESYATGLTAREAGKEAIIDDIWVSPAQITASSGGRSDLFITDLDYIRWNSFAVKNSV
jgi:hypothetical protein